MSSHKKMSPIVHNSPEFKEARKAFQGINSTPKKALEKSKRRVAEKMFKHMSEAEKEKHVNSGTGRRLTKAEQAFKTKDWPRATGRNESQKAQMSRSSENRESQRRTGKAWSD